MHDFQTNPNPQFMNYKMLTQKLTGEKVTGELDILGVSKTKDASELLRREPVDYTPHQMEEWRRSVLGHIRQMGVCEETGYYPQTWRCKPFFRDCTWLPLCTLPNMDSHDKLLATMYKEERWDPFMVTD